MKPDLNILHYGILRFIIKHGYAPEADALGEMFNTDIINIKDALKALQEYHGVVLHPHESKIWAIHPFSLAPTNFYVNSKTGGWWANCAWCALGVAALLNDDVTITTTIGAETTQVQIHIEDGQIKETDFWVHFPIPMKNAWDNVIYTCSTMLLFQNGAQADLWSKKHNIPRGDLQPIEKIWRFAQRWYGNHLNPNWSKWTIEQARSIFDEFNLHGPIWELNESRERF